MAAGSRCSGQPAADSILEGVARRASPRRRARPCWQGYDQRFADHQRQIHEVKQAQGSVCSQRLKENQQRLERKIATLAATNGSSGERRIAAANAEHFCTRCLHLRCENARCTPACELERSGKRPLLPDRREGLFQFIAICDRRSSLESAPDKRRSTRWRAHAACLPCR